MVIVNVAQKGDQLKEAILAAEIANTLELKFDKKEGMKYYFTTNNDDVAVTEIKKFIKATPAFAFLYTSVMKK
ncbi:MAG: hypothetical protein MR210_07885 [Erysipelotrichaceae bacterium]|nr:hypothetical protein [Erysipelotrichaceae bacterium]MDY5252948.1 hypothetical protein [Erysipelotrichaceae bacterium]